MINAMRKEYIYGTDTGAETPDKMAQGYEMQRGRNDWDNAPDGHTQKTGRLDAVAGEESESDAFGDSGDCFGNSRYEELIGNTLTVPCVIYFGGGGEQPEDGRC